MSKRIRSVVTAIAAIAALATGGAVFANAQNSASSPPTNANEPAQEQGAPENSATDKDNVQDENGRDDATEGKEAPDKGEASENGAEVPGDDGPGGHADEPGNPNADHQFEGQE